MIKINPVGKYNNETIKLINGINYNNDLGILEEFDLNIYKDYTFLFSEKNNINCKNEYTYINLLINLVDKLVENKFISNYRISDLYNEDTNQITSFNNFVRITTYDGNFTIILNVIYRQGINLFSDYFFEEPIYIEDVINIILILLIQCDIEYNIVNSNLSYDEDINTINFSGLQYNRFTFIYEIYILTDKFENTNIINKYHLLLEIYSSYDNRYCRTISLKINEIEKG